VRRSDRYRDQLVYQRRKKGENFESLASELVRRLAAAVAARLAVERIAEQVCFIELSYRAGDVHFPPLVVIGLERDRRRMLASGDPEAPLFAFNAAMLGSMHYVEIDDPETTQLCDRLEQEVRAGGRWKAATRILREVAAELTRRDWTGLLDVTGEFVVFAIDWEMEGDDLERILAASVSGEQIREWRKNGWLGD
jgi:hypothetical protein